MQGSQQVRVSSPCVNLWTCPEPVACRSCPIDFPGASPACFLLLRSWCLTDASRTEVWLMGAVPFLNELRKHRGHRMRCSDLARPGLEKTPRMERAFWVAQTHSSASKKKQLNALVVLDSSARHWSILRKSHLVLSWSLTWDSHGTLLNTSVSWVTCRKKETSVGGTFLWAAHSKGRTPPPLPWKVGRRLVPFHLCCLEQMQKNLPAMGFAWEVKVCTCQAERLKRPRWRNCNMSRECAPRGERFGTHTWVGTVTALSLWSGPGLASYVFQNSDKTPWPMNHDAPS